MPKLVYKKNGLRVIIKLGPKTFVDTKQRIDGDIRQTFVEAQEDFELKSGNDVRPFRVVLKEGVGRALKTFSAARDEGPMDVIGKAMDWYKEFKKQDKDENDYDEE